ncbi:MAG: hypothetical protein H0W18_10050, partial [Acidobacteria bacterium]|nr:hypothetical protein [Acidobacteriota bacterium]
KITVIATGFERPPATWTSTPSAATTPVDLQNYASWKQEGTERTAAASSSRVSFSRRPVIDLPTTPPPPAPTADPGSTGLGAEFEPLDVPAFLRRQND